MASIAKDQVDKTKRKHMRSDIPQNYYEDGLKELETNAIKNAAYCFIYAATCGHRQALVELQALSSTLSADPELQRYLLVEILYHLPRLQNKQDHFAALSQLIQIPEDLVTEAVMQAADANQQTYEISCALLRTAAQIADREDRKRTEQAALRGLISTLFQGFYPAFQYLNTPAVQARLPIRGTTKDYFTRGLLYFNQLQRQLGFALAHRQAQDPLARLALEIASRSPSPSLTESSIPEEPEQEQLARSNDDFLRDLPENLKRAFSPYNG